MDGFEILDIHQHAWSTNCPADLFAPNQPTGVDEDSFNGTVAQMNELGIKQAVISGPNSVSREWYRRAPDRFIPFWAVTYPLDLRVEADNFSRALETQEFRGLGELLLPYTGLPLNDERFFPLYKICEERRLPVLFHTGLDGPDGTTAHMGPALRMKLSDPLLLEDVVAAFPDLTIIMAHMSWPFTEQATFMLYAYPNVYMDVSATNWNVRAAGFHRLLRQVVETVGVDKVLFGSDQMCFPDVIPTAVDLIRKAHFLTDEDKRKILGNNARRLLGIGLAPGADRTPPPVTAGRDVTKHGS